MIKTLLSDGNLSWMYAFFFEGDYPLVLQLGIINALAVIVLVVMRAAVRPAVRNSQIARMLSWVFILANVLLVLNKDHRFIAFLA